MNTVDLKLTLVESAQCFHWKEHNGAFYGVVNGKPYALTQENCGILSDYLDLERDYSFLMDEYGHIPAARMAFERFPGIRILNQDTWETVVSFILSANNNVSRIRSLVNKVCAAYGDEYELDGIKLYGFPTPERLASADVSEFGAMGMGYRAPYLSETARKIADGFSLDALGTMPYEEAHKQLLTLKGVGDKVADCIQLFGLGFDESFPVDVWVARLMENWFGVTGSAKKVGTAARAMFGKHGGILQQYLFHAARMGLIDENGILRQ